MIIDLFLIVQEYVSSEILLFWPVVLSKGHHERLEAIIS